MKLTRLAVAGTGTLLATYVLARPWGAGDTGSAWADPRWPLSHLAAMAGFTTFSLATWVAGSAHGGRLGRVVEGAGLLALPLLLPYYGAEAFALHAIGQQPGLDAATQEALATAIRMGGVQVTTFGLGWLALAVAGLGFAAATQRSNTAIGRVAGWVLGAGLATYLPVFYAPMAIRLAHGVIIGIAALAWATLSASQPRRPAARSSWDVRGSARAAARRA